MPDYIRDALAPRDQEHPWHAEIGLWLARREPIDSTAWEILEEDVRAECFVLNGQLGALVAEIGGLVELPTVFYLLPLDELGIEEIRALDVEYRDLLERIWRLVARLRSCDSRLLPDDEQAQWDEELHDLEAQIPLPDELKAMSDMSDTELIPQMVIRIARLSPDLIPKIMDQFVMFSKNMEQRTGTPANRF